MKLVSALMITASFTLLGRYAAQRSARRCESIENILIMLSSIKSRLGFICIPVYDLLDVLCDDGRLKSLEFIGICREKCFGGEPFPSAWESAVSACAVSSKITRADALRLCEFGKSIGTTDLNGQLAVCELYIQLFADRREECRAAKAKYTGVLPPLGFLGGLAVSVLLI